MLQYTLAPNGMNPDPYPHFPFRIEPAGAAGVDAAGAAAECRARGAVAAGAAAEFGAGAGSPDLPTRHATITNVPYLQPYALFLQHLANLLLWEHCLCLPSSPRCARRFRQNPRGKSIENLGTNNFAKGKFPPKTFGKKGPRPAFSPPCVHRSCAHRPGR